MRVLLVVVISLQLLACAGVPAGAPTYPESLRSCVEKLVHFKRQVSRQRVADAQLLWSALYPHLAFDRFSLSLINELESDLARQQWLSYVTRQATEQRNIEYRNLPDPGHIDLATINGCARRLTRASASDERWWQQLQQAPPVYASDYQRWQKILGLYPISRLLIAPVIAGEKNHIRDGFKQPPAMAALGYRPITGQVPDRHQIRSWFGAPQTGSDLAWTLLSRQQSRELLNFYAPNWLIETASDDDKPGTVGYGTDGRARVDPQQPAMYVYASYTRFGGQILTQLNYTLWFANRTPTSSFDPYAGKFDAVLLRLTLDQHGQPYILDSIHSCGCYHMVFRLNSTLKFSQPTHDREQPLTMFLPNSASRQAALTVTLSEKKHMVKWVETDNKALIKPHIKARSTPLTVLPYDRLRSLAFQPQYNKSLFDPLGMLMASKRGERWFLWPFGVRSPGAMRQTGHHAITFIGERHFDDPFIFESLFIVD